MLCRGCVEVDTSNARRSPASRMKDATLISSSVDALCCTRRHRTAISNRFTIPFAGARYDQIALPAAVRPVYESNVFQFFQLFFQLKQKQKHKLSQIQFEQEIAFLVYETKINRNRPMS